MRLAQFCSFTAAYFIVRESVLFSSVYSLDDVLCLLVYLYSVAGQSLLDLEDEESQLQVR